MSLKMIIKLDTQKIENPDQFGELFRKICFKEEMGCYSCFELTDDFNKISSDSAEGLKLIKVLGLAEEPDSGDISPEDLAWMENSLLERLEKAKNNLYSNGTILIGWYWDGDGSLAIIEGNKAVVNHDCKKDYTWDWFLLD